MSEWGMRILEIAGAVAILGLVLSHSGQFVTVIKGAGSIYNRTVGGLEHIG